MLLKRGFRLLKSTQSSLSRDFCCLSISLRPLDSLRPRGLRQAPYLHFHLSSLIGRPPESLPRGFPFRVSVLPKVSRLLHLESRDSCCLSISLRPRGLRQTPYLHFHQSPARKSPERLSFPSQRPPESFPTTPPEISRFPFGTKVIKILDLSPYLPPTRPFTVSPTLPYSPKPVLPISKASPSPTTPPDRILSSRSSIAFHVLSSFHPVLQQHSSVQFITSYNYQVRFPDRSLRIVILQTGNSQLATHGIARNLKRSAPM